MKYLITTFLIVSLTLQPLGLISPVLAETINIKYTDPNHLHAPKEVNGVTYQYDANGNLTSDGERTISWNQDNLPIKIVKSGKTVEFFYDASGRRIAKRSEEGETIYVNQYYQLFRPGDGRPLAETKYYFANGRVAQKTGDNLVFLHQDHLGSTVLATNSNSQPVSNSLSYFPYGSSISNEQLTISNYLFTGQESDPESNLYNYNARLYNPRTGVFISADTVGGGNRYAYAANNPMVFTDPTGHYHVHDGGGGGGGRRGPADLEYEITRGKNLYEPPGITATDIITLESPQLPAGNPEDFPKLIAGMAAVSLAPVVALAIPEISIATTVFLLTHPEVVLALKVLGFAGAATTAIQALRGDETAAFLLYESWYMGIMTQAFQNAYNNRDRAASLGADHIKQKIDLQGDPNMENREIFCQGPLIKVKDKWIYQEGRTKGEINGDLVWGLGSDHEDGILISIKECLKYRCCCPEIERLGIKK